VLKDILFQVSALNKIIPEPSPWSSELLSMAESHTNTADNADAGHLMGMSAAMLATIVGGVLLIVILALALTVICAAEARRRRKRYSNVPIYSERR